MRYLNRINSLFALYFLSFSIFSDGHETSIDTVIEKETDSLIYIGLGSADDSDIVGEEPWSVGFIYREENNFFGLDIAGEGVKINQARDYYDGTYYVESTEQATSFNLIAGIKVSGDSSLRTDLGLLIGIVEQSEECPTSYSGYNCYYSSYYQNQSDVEYTFNYGLALHATYDRVTFGIRATGESTQIIFGFNF
tara:strand:- start:329 stop:910 length:582 start_codon:yes stop_codon:yes gene_type:complete